MKSFLISLVIVPSFVLLSNFAAITKALGTGDVDTLAKYFDEKVEISIGDNDNTMSKTQAVVAVKDFFQKNKPKSFVQSHTGTSKGKESQYCIGDLSTANGNYRVYISLKTEGDTGIIQELRFDK